MLPHTSAPQLSCYTLFFLTKTRRDSLGGGDNYYNLLVILVNKNVTRLLRLKCTFNLTCGPRRTCRNIRQSSVTWLRINSKWSTSDWAVWESWTDQLNQLQTAEHERREFCQREDCIKYSACIHAEDWTCLFVELTSFSCTVWLSWSTQLSSHSATQVTSITRQYFELMWSQVPEHLTFN
jgi:hypothetical protein